jgi:hypothetical protein
MAEEQGGWRGEAEEGSIMRGIVSGAGATQLILALAARRPRRSG